ncbi:hypothetical protein BJ138DRAFT_256999 [Hygrophoropsis aurantiaca]|uniref:Uncharacterized protein n=1 Tax=Hygrophoropsis aurantiaca TaxID=72124 RepID=A0ACB7ZP81_9AGAM|nr:hypothetical protein BJ138DRAFT_256999 [Hygrophoropsis aurantiaca]
MTAFFNYFDFHSIETIALRPSSPELSVSTGVQEFFAALASSCSRNSIHGIYIQWVPSGLPPRDIARLQPLRMDEFRPLLQFHRLQKLTLSIPRPLVLEDAMLLAMADAWPHLSDLYLTIHGPWHSGSYITPMAFIALLERCPKLERLNIPMDFSAIDYADFDPLSIDVLRIQDRTGALAELTELVLGPYRIAHPRSIARFLSAVLPDSARIYMMFNVLPEEEAGRGASFRQTIECMQQMVKERMEQCGE